MSATSTDPFDFDSLEPVQIPVRYDGKRYVLCDASGGTVAKYRAAMLNSAQMRRNADKSTNVSGMGGLADAEFVLLAGCLWYANEDGTKGKSTVPESTLRSWPNRVTEPLARKAKEVSMVDTEEGDDGPKALPPATGTGS